MSYSQDLSDCQPDGFEAVREELPAVRRILSDWVETGARPLLNLPGREDDIVELERVSARLIGRFERLVVFGTGGSALGAKALLALPQAASRPQVLVPDNLDGEDLDGLFSSPLGDTAFIVISKSGGTAETLVQALGAVAACRAQGIGDLAERLVFISEDKDSPLSRLAGALGAPVLPHDPEIGGRYSVLSLVGVLPALCAGLDVRTMRRGAGAVLEAALADNDAAPCLGAAAAVSSLRSGRNQAVLLAYGPRFELLVKWWRQLWGESLGKDGLGQTPIDAVGPVDQHSQLQLWRAGPDDKFYTILTRDPRGQGPALDDELAHRIGAGDLAGRTPGDLVYAMQQATAETLAAVGRPVRRLAVPRLDEEVWGALFMHFCLETMLAAGLMGVNAFDQPAVDDGKQRAMRMLAAMAAP